MAEEGVKRKLISIFSADAKGFSRLMGKDEIGTNVVKINYFPIFSATNSNLLGMTTDVEANLLFIMLLNSSYSTGNPCIVTAIYGFKSLTILNASSGEHVRQGVPTGTNATSEG